MAERTGGVRKRTTDPKKLDPVLLAKLAYKKEMIEEYLGKGVNA